MKKKGLFLILAIFLFLISFASAYYGSYSSFSIGDLLDNIDSSTMILGALFIIFFFILNLTFGKFFKDSGGNPSKGAWIPALATTSLIIYGLNKTNFNFEELFYNIGFSEDILTTILPLIILAGIIYFSFSKKIGFRKVLISLGGLLILVSFTDLIYEKGITLILGIILLGIGIWLWKKKPKEEQSRNYSYSYTK